MHSQRISKDQSIALIMLAIAGFGVDQSKNVVDSFLPKENEPAFIGNGCKLYLKREGCISYYIVSGYANNGEDVRRCLVALASAALEKGKMHYRVINLPTHISIERCNRIHRMSENCTPSTLEIQSCG